ncbi:MAG: BMP family protein [Lactobacillaceae bacterium]|jgi:basic membrane protein A|nr:BMP family protein [Lactobacillaceae bacterium]
MNRSTKIVAALSAVVLVAVGGYLATQSNSSTKEKFTVAMVTDAPGNISDHSFGQAAWTGLQAWGKDHDLKKGVNGYDYFISKTQADFTPNFDQAVASKFSLIGAIGYNLQEAVEKAAKQYPKTKFALVDSVADAKYKNIQSLMFNSEQSSYLTGVAAATKAKALGDTKVGFLGGMKGPVVGRFEYGFREGVASVDKKIKVEAVYAGSYADPAKGQLIANTMIAEGIHIINHVSGGTGNGAFTAVKQHDETLASGSKAKVWMIGVDIDQAPQGAYTTKDDKKDNFTLTSSLTNVGRGLELSANAAMQDKFQGGKVTYYGLKEGGVSVPTDNLNGPEKAAVEKAKKGIETGAIKLNYKNQYAN